ncbi:MAG: hypothetical protein AB8B91_18145 [Rubripirellula sp.]
MPEFLTTPTVQAGAAVLVLCVLIAAGFYLMASFRDYAAEDRETSEDVLVNLSEMHLKGDISDEEFRTIKSRTHRQTLESSKTDESSLPDVSSPNDQTQTED